MYVLYATSSFNVQCTRWSDISSDISVEALCSIQIDLETYVLCQEFEHVSEILEFGDLEVWNEKSRCLRETNMSAFSISEWKRPNSLCNQVQLRQQRREPRESENIGRPESRTPKSLMDKFNNSFELNC